MFFSPNNIFQKTFPGLIIILALLASFFVFAREPVTEETCQALLEDAEKECANLSEEECQQLLNDCLDFYQEQSDEYKEQVEQSQQEQRTLQGRINAINNQIQQYNNEIYRSNLTIKDLNFQIEDTQNSIEKTIIQIEESKQRLADLLRLVEEQGRRSLVEIMLAEEQLSSFFDELAALEALSLRNQELLQNIRDLKDNLKQTQEDLRDDKEELEHVIVLNQLQRERTTELRQEQEWILQKTRGEEALYQEHLKEAQERASEIRKKIFALAQVATEDAPTHEEAYQLAKYAESITGVRPALILGLLQMESALGKNVGQCNCAGRPNCRHPNLTYKDVMHRNHWSAFETVTNELGLDIWSTPVSCSISGGMVQWGGAMGPAQFMPNTWLNLGYRDRVAAITGQPASPWRVRDAFLASGLYLMDWGANSRVRQTEIGAVTAYLCGTSSMTNVCRNAGGEWYRYTVMKNAEQWEQWIAEGIF